MSPGPGVSPTPPRFSELTFLPSRHFSGLIMNHSDLPYETDNSIASFGRAFYKAMPLSEQDNFVLVC